MMEMLREQGYYQRIIRFATLYSLTDSTLPQQDRPRSRAVVFLLIKNRLLQYG